MIYSVPIDKTIKEIDIISNINTEIGAIHIKSDQGIHFTGEMPEDIYPLVYSGESGDIKWHGHIIEKNAIEAKGNDNSVDALILGQTDVRFLLVKKSQIYEYLKNNMNQELQQFQLARSYQLDENSLEIFQSIHNRILKKEQIPNDELMPLLLQLTKNPIIREPASKNNFDLTQKAIRLMKEHLKSPITISELSNLLKVNIRTLELIFNKHFNLSPKSYYKRLLYLDIEKELRKRNPEEKTISDILETYQIYDLSSFGKYFKDYFELKPSEIGFNNEKVNPLGWNEKIFSSFLGEDNLN